MVSYNTTRRRARKLHKAEAEFIGRPDRSESAVEVERVGIPRPRIRAPKTFAPGLTAKQRRTGRVRTCRSWGRVLKTLADTGMTMDEFVNGLSNEELARGQVKAKDGTFRGAPPAFVPRAFHRACIGELMRRGKTLWQENYIGAIETMTKIAQGSVKGASARDRLVAAQFVIERLEGKVPEKLIVETDQPWALVINDIVADVTDDAIVRAQKALNGAQAVAEELTDIVDAEIVEEPVKPHRAPRRRAAR
jgi:hypothetical protein